METSNFLNEFKSKFVEKISSREAWTKNEILEEFYTELIDLTDRLIENNKKSFSLFTDKVN